MRSIFLWSILMLSLMTNSWAVEKSAPQKTPDIDILLINMAWGNNNQYTPEILSPSNTLFNGFYDLTPREQKIWKIGELSEEKISEARWWTILAGFGIGHNICGHWMPLSRGWIYTFIDLELLLAPPIIGIMNMGSNFVSIGAAAAGGASYTSSSDNDSLIFLATWGALLVITRIIQVIDLNLTIDEHNKAYSAIQVKMGGG